ncbi:MAG: nucleotidyl transferase AbiEii/AbiGii toxin family protein [Armatimonadetes bacterium]|nr:nucleotidyl transferase AbiEii/AbiGii toxin family protein [Armatimonadota bacterium]
MESESPKQPLGNQSQPGRPLNLTPLMEAVPEALRLEPAANRFILGGGVALKRYIDYRPTQDIDAWWIGGRDPEAVLHLRAALECVAARQGYAQTHRQFRMTDSFEFRHPDSGRKEFSFQISVRDLALDAARESLWPPLKVETLQDNIGSKMNALVNRGAPRDFTDIYRVVRSGLIEGEERWRLWQIRNPEFEISQAKRQVRTHLIRLEARRPLSAISSEEERGSTAGLRAWFHESFLNGSEG